MFHDSPNRIPTANRVIDFEFAKPELAKEVYNGDFQEPSRASGVTPQDSNPEPLVCWMIEKCRSPVVDRYSGTMSHPLARGKQALTIAAFAHFVYSYSGGEIVIADIQGMRLVSSDNQTTHGQ